MIQASFKGEDHRDRISYQGFYGGFEWIGWEKSGYVIMICLSSYSKHSCINKRVLSSCGEDAFLVVWK